MGKDEKESGGTGPVEESAGEVLEALPAGEAGLEAQPAGETAVDDDLEKLRKELEVVNGRYVRLAADFDNYRKRQARERQETVAYANEALLAGILPVVDNLERALAAASGASGGAKGLEGVVKGVELTLRMFQGILGRNGVERMKVLGEKFDPHRHEAVAQKSVADLAPETVTDELEAGYTLNGRVLRSAKVRVACPPAPAPAEGGERKEGTAEETKKEETDA